jgi:DNA polymerase (family 10)
VIADTEPDSGERIGGGEEEDVFRSLELPWIPPLLRENRGEMEAAGEGGLPDLLTVQDMKGDLQMHSTWSDGANSLKEMAEACREMGYEYLSITDHSQAVTVAGGLKPPEVRAQWEEVEEVREAVKGIHLFRSLEVDILKDGSLDMPDEILAELDLVLVSVHSFTNMPKEEMTNRVIRALEHPEVDILAHPTGRILNRREPFEMDVDAVLQAAAELEVAVELNAHPSRLDLHDLHLRRAKELGAKVVISTDAHSARDLGFMGYGVDQARRGWLEAGDVLNTLPLRDLQVWRERRRKE